jgi:transcriptional regulator with XRE-family HTH domain
MNVKPAIKRPEGPKAQADYEEKRSSVRSQLAQIFKESRQTKGLSLHILAEMTKISMASLSRYENALRTPSEQDKLRIALALDLDAGALPKVLDKIAFKAAIPRINTIDVESYLIKREQTYYQGYLSQIAVDSKSQVVVAAGISPTNSDQTFVAQAITQIAQNLQQTPKTIAADSGYCSEDNLKIAEEAGVDFLCPPGKLRPGAVRRSEPLRQMEARLAEPATWKTYLMRAQTVEPVFGDKKLNQGFDRYFVRGLVKVAGDWFQKMTVHNLMKLFRAQILP